MSDIKERVLALKAEGHSNRAISRKTGVPHSNVDRIVRPDLIERAKAKYRRKVLAEKIVALVVAMQRNNTEETEDQWYVDNEAMWNAAAQLVALDDELTGHKCHDPNRT